MKTYLPDTILMTADTVGGVWTYALELTKALGEYNIVVYLATMGEKLSSSQWKSAGEIPNLVIKESDFALEWMDDPWDEVDKAGQWLLELEQQIQPDLVHLNNYVHGTLPWNTPVLMVGHSCVLSWWQAVKNEEAPADLDVYAARVKAGLQQADSVIGVSEFMLNKLREFYGPFAFSDYIYNARDQHSFYSSAKKPMVFSMGRVWDEAKNISTLEAISGDLSWPVYIAGDRDDSKAAEIPNVNYLDKINSDEVTEWLGKTSIYVMPARYEPFGLSILEAALSGCALVLGDIPSLKEVWGGAAMYADPDNPFAFRHQVQTLIQNAAKRQSMAKKAMERAQLYSVDRFAGQYTAMYRQLLQLDKEKLVAE